MKTALFTSFAFFASTAVAAETAALAGQWQVHSSIAGNESDMVCTFAQKDEVLSGNCSSDKGKFEITGKVNGRKVAWSYKSEYDGSPLTVKYDGTLDSPARMKGSVDVPEFGAAGDFTASQSDK